MAEQFYKGRTNNHLQWVMVDATDFATPESALSAATKIKIYGKLKSATGVNFVSSGTGSLTNDIQHVGASALGIYTIALAKADLSDASAAWYDTYIISLSATGAAYQAIIADGGIYHSYMSDVASYLSNLQSNLSGIGSDILSGVVALSDAVSNAYSAAVVGASRVLLVQSRLSDLDSRLASDTSDILSQVLLATSAASDAASAAQQANSRVLLVQSRLSDLDSRIASDFSDLMSNIDAVTATLTASDISDIASAVWAAKYTAHSAASSFGSMMSDIYSRVALTQSAASDAASAAQQANSRVLVAQSMISDVDSALSSQFTAMSALVSDAHSAAILAASHASDAHSAALLAQSMISDVDSALSSQFTVHQSTLSDILSAVTEVLTLVPSGPPKNTAFTYVIKMVDATDFGTPETGLTVTMTRSIDGAAFGAATGTVTEISTGHYKVAASAADMNGDVVAHRFTATGAADLTMEFKTVS